MSTSTLPPDVNPSQWAAVTHRGRHLLIVAGPGTGKTHTLTYRICYTREQLKTDQRILAVTFTNKAAREMEERLLKRLDDPQKMQSIDVGTFHHFCLQFLRQHAELLAPQGSFCVADSEAIEQLSRIQWPECSRHQRKELLDKFSQWKSTQPVFAELPQEFSAYHQLLHKNNLFDFDDILRETVKIFDAHPDIAETTRAKYPFIFVDEYQDINLIQHALLKILVKGEDVSLTAIGDPHQSIYGFRGADVRCFENFSGDFPGATALSLNENYRSAANLLQASGQLIRQAYSMPVAALTAKIYQEGRLVVHESPTDKAEAEYVVHQIERLIGGTSMFSRDSKRVNDDHDESYTFGDIAVLYRLHGQARSLQEALARSGIPYQIVSELPLVAQKGIYELAALWILIQDDNHQGIAKQRCLEALKLFIDGLGEETAKSMADVWRNKNLISFADVEWMASQHGSLPARVREGLNKLNAVISEGRNQLKSGDVKKTVAFCLSVPLIQRTLENCGVEKNCLQRLRWLAIRSQNFTAFLDNLSLQHDVDSIDEKAEKVSLLTMHAAKGLEFPVVFIPGCEEHLLPLQLNNLTSDVQEERRLFYVGMTRAKQRLYLTRARRRHLFGQTHENAPSRFLSDIEESLKAYEKSEHKMKVNRPKKEDPQLNLFDL